MKRGRKRHVNHNDVRIAFITKTNMAYRHHDLHSLEQLRRFEAGNYESTPIAGYKIKHLETDVERNPGNLSLMFKQVLVIVQGEKRWGYKVKGCHNQMVSKGQRHIHSLLQRAE